MKYYLDNTATTKPLPAVIEKMVEVMQKTYANPSSLHLMGVEAEKEIENTRELIAQSLGVKAKEIYFTSGGTESNNFAIFGSCTHTSHTFVTDIGEHASVLSCGKELEQRGHTVFYIPLDHQGNILWDDLKNFLDKKPRLLTLMQVNNELGTLLDIERVANFIQKFSPNTLLHIDGVQAYGKLTTYPKELGIDLYSFSGHKIYGPKGVGGLYINEKVHLKPILFGGGQEKNLRSGTENVYAIAGLGEAVKDSILHRDARYKKVSILKEVLSTRFSSVKGIKILGGEESSPYLLTLAIAHIRSEILLHYLEEKGIYASTGSACSKGKISSVIKALHLPKEYEEGVLRISISPEYSVENMEWVAKTMISCIEEIREIIGGKF